MPTTSAGAHGADPFEQARLASRQLLRAVGQDTLDVLVVLGTGLQPTARMLGAQDPPVDLASLPWMARFTAIGHRSTVWPVQLGGLQVLVTGGRLHLYEGLTPAEVVHPVRTAIGAGCRTVILTCSAGGIDPALTPGSVVALADHLNLTASSPLSGLPADHPMGSPYLDLTDLWSPGLRQLARQVDPSLPEAVYAQMPGPHLETPAEIRMLAGLGAGLVGMSMVPEAIAARHLGAEVLGLAVVANLAAGTGTGSAAIELDEVTAMGAGASGAMARLVQGVIERLGAPAEGSAPDS